MAGALDDCAISLGGTFPGQTQAQLSKYLKSIGATVTPSVTKKTTHVITTDADVGTNAKVRAGQQQGCHIVSLEWAQESERQGSRADEADFAIGSTPPPAATNGKKSVNGTSNGKADVAVADASQSNGNSQDGDTSTARRSGRKRAAPAPTKSDSEDEPAPKAKKPKAAATKSKKAQGAESDEEEPAPKAKGKAAASKSKKAVSADSDEDDKGAASQNGKPDSKGKGKGKAAAAKSKKAESADSDEDDKGAASQNGKVKAEKKPTVADGQVLKSKTAVIPVDEGVALPNPTVYVDPAGIIFDAALNQTNSGRNNNKFYRLQLLKSNGSYHTWTRWGRVGERGQSALLGSGSLADAMKNFDKKFKDKSGLKWDDRAQAPKPNKYAFVERSYDPDSEDDEDDAPSNVKAEEDDEESEEELVCTLAKPVQELLGLIFNATYLTAALSDLKYDAQKLPLGKLSKSTILKGFQALKDLSAVMNDNTLGPSVYGQNAASAIESLSNLFYSLIPHDFGRNRPPIIGSSQQLKREIELLDSLSDMKAAADIMKLDKKVVNQKHPADAKYEALGMEEMSVLDHKSSEFQLLEAYLQGSKGETHNHNYKVLEIFRIERQGETDRFDQSIFSKVKSDRRLLWHGSRSTNFGGILSQGLRIAPPEAPVNGYMFDKGVYLADMASKSANYCCSYSSGGHALLLLCEAELGDPMLELVNADYNASTAAKAHNAHSTWGKGMTGPSKWMDAGAVHPSLKGIKMPDTAVKPGPTNVQGAYLQYNEYIAYDVAQIKLRYLFRVKM
ncbi:poly polymerase catalytic domain-containing protein [Plectosphaerella plurivora]|uniref:Poly [ADP-ribose] polymerase n=1 Tax=Plectosphaerella plurivora TaxID=936078 RepID=A0A9P8VGN8_9PEZI|nr:poly polymerase catalytic domain-containing protein [Plectosphaerella plurivora]